MAEQTIGVLKAVLAADTAAFTKAMADASADVKQLAERLQSDLEPRQRAVNAAVRDFMGGSEIRKAQEYAQAVEKIGGATVLTAADQQKVNKAVTDALDHYRKLGIEAPANLVKLENQTRNVEKATGLLDQQWAKVAASFGAGVLIDRAISGLVAFGKAAIEDAGKVVDLADKTGLSTRAVQVYGEAAKQAGGDLETIADAVFKLGVNMEKGGDQAKAALGALGLSLKQVQDLKPEQQFELIAEKLKNVSSAQERNRLGVDLFGKSWASVAPAVVAGIDGIADSMSLMSDEQVRALDKAADAWDQFWNDVKRKTAATLGDIVIDVQNATSGWSKFIKDIGATGSGLLSGGLSGAREGHDAFIASLRAEADAQTKAAAAGKDNAEQVRKSREDAEAAAKATAEAAAKAKQWATEIQNLANKLSGANIDLEIQKMAAAVHALKGQIDGGQLPAMVKQLQEWRDTGRQLPPVLEAIRKAQQDLNVALKAAFNFDTEVKAEKLAAKVNPNLDLSKIGKAVALPENPTIAADQRLLNQALAEAFAAIEQLAGKAKDEHVEAATEAAKAWQQKFEHIGNSVLAAIIGGGDIGQAVGATIGNEIGQSLANSLADVLKRTLGDKIGGAIASLLPGIGSAFIGPLISKGINFLDDHLFGGKGRKANDLRDSLKAQLADAVKGVEGDQAVQAALNGFNTAGSEDAVKRTFDAAIAAAKAAKEKLADLQAQAEKTAAAIEGALGAIGPATANIVGGFSAKLKPALDTIDELKKKQEALGRDGDTAGAQKVGIELLEKQRQAVVANQGEFDRLNRITLAGFNAQIAQGKSAVEAVAAVGPAIDQLKTASEQFGFAGSAAYDQLSRWRTLTADNQPLLDQVSGLNDLMAALSTLGALDADTFADMQAQGVSAFDSLTAAGFTQQEALTQMKPLLENIVKLHNDRGLAIDSETQKLIDQATEDGILKAEQIDTNQVLMDGLGAVIEALGGKVPDAWKKFGNAAKDATGAAKDGLDDVTDKATDIFPDDGSDEWKVWRKHAEEAASGVQSALDGIEAPALEIPVSFRTYGNPDGGPDVSGADGTGFAGGTHGLRNFDPSGEWHKLHGHEEVVTAGQGSGVASMVREALAGANGGGDFSGNVYLSDRLVGRAMFGPIVREARRQKVTQR